VLDNEVELGGLTYLGTEASYLEITDMRIEQVAKPVKVFLCDLTHVNGEVLSSNVFPLGIGLIGSYLLSSDIGSSLQIELFKYPNDLNEKLKKSDIPNIIGFANYSWSYEISKSFSKAIKANFPHVVTVFGGPNYGLSEDEVQNFWGEMAPILDFNVILEGEVAFHSLVQSLLSKNFDIEGVKSDPEGLKNVHFVTTEGSIHKSDIAERINIEELASPYLDTTLMDKFFDGNLIPLTHSTRGCPFKCTFCSEGSNYYNKVKQRSNRIYEEYRYIAEKSVKVKVYDLMLADANYGMFKEDSLRAEMLARVQRELGYPKNVYVSTGKNQKERVLSAVKKLNGAIQLSASLQSTNPQVLENIERSNISIEVLSAAAHEALDNHVVSYTELILGLPGESLETHLKSVLDVVRAGFVNIRIYQLILLPQTELNTSETRKRFGFKTKFRPMPRSFGNYQVLFESVFVAEYEEIVVQSETLPYGDYVLCRKAGLLTDLIHNGFIFRECQRLLALSGIPWDEFLGYVFYLLKEGRISGRLEEHLNTFIDLMEIKLFDSLSDLKKCLSNVSIGASIQKLTSNELATQKAKIIVDDFSSLNDFVYGCIADFIEIRDCKLSRDVISSIKEYSLISKNNFICDFSVKELGVSLVKDDFQIFFDAIDYPMPSELSAADAASFTLTLCHSVNQQSDIEQLISLYGRDLDGLSRIVMRSPILQQKFRSVSSIVVSRLDATEVISSTVQC
jgi:radical SAM superfamily enzyme YgiQ (UPF0313 family)